MAQRWCGSEAMSIQQALIFLGIALVALGLLWPLIGKIGLGSLPGDIFIERENFRLYIPLTSSLIVSLVVSLLYWLFHR